MLKRQHIEWPGLGTFRGAAIVAVLIATAPASMLSLDNDMFVTEAMADPNPLEGEPTTQQIIQNRMEQFLAQGELTIGDEGIAAKRVHPVFYEGRGFEPAWTTPGAVAELQLIIAATANDGLVPSDYHQAAILALARTNDSAADPARLADLDVLCTDAFLSLAYHMTFGKVDPERLDPNWNIYGETVEISSVVDWLQKVLGGDDVRGIGRTIDEIRPPQDLYRDLVAALIEYRSIQERGGWPTFPEGPALKEGMSDARVIELRERLKATGDLSPESAAESANQVDAEVLAGVEHYQVRHGLDADGIVGHQTLAALNVPVADRISQIRVNLERLRWVLHGKIETFVVVNIAGFKVFYVRDGELVWDARAQVGTQYRQTPVFRADMKYLVFNPTWTVPPTILREDILPKATQDSSYLEQKRISVVDRDGRIIPADQVDWQRYDGGNFPFSLRQEPGPHNALGLVKFIFPNEHFVFLHDTPSRALFSRSQRAFSSGCIRVDEPLAFAEELLNDPQKWSIAEIERIISSAKTKTVHLQEPVPVLLLYWTAFEGLDGQIHFREDIYGRDQAVLQDLDSEFRVRARHLREETRQ